MREQQERARLFELFENYIRPVYLSITDKITTLSQALETEVISVTNSDYRRILNIDSFGINSIANRCERSVEEYRSLYFDYGGFTDLSSFQRR